MTALDTTITTCPAASAPLDELHARVERAARGDEAAQRELARELLSRIRGQMVYLVSISHTRDDLTQLAIIEILKSLHNFNQQGSFWAWADRITVRTAMRHIKKERWWRRQFLNELPHAQAASPSSQRAELYILRRRLSALLHKLSPDRRAVLVLRYVQGYSIQEIAQITESLENTVRGRLRTGKKQLKQLIVRDEALSQWVDQWGLIDQPCDEQEEA